MQASSASSSAAGACCQYWQQTMPWSAHQAADKLLAATRFACLVEPFGGASQTWSIIASCQPDGLHMMTLMRQQPALVAAFVHCCYLVRCHPEADPESFLSSFSIAQAIDAAEEFFSADSSVFADDDDVFYEVSLPDEPLVGS